LSLDGKVAIVTGGGRGIGEGIARRFVEAGARVVIVDVVDARALADDLGERAHSVVADVSDEEAVGRTIADIVDAQGRIDILCNNAGIDGEHAMTVDCTLENFDRVHSVNTRGVFLGMKYVLPVMISQGGGTIINVASAAGIVGMPKLAAYCSSKAAVLGLTRTAALEYGGLGIRVNAICPGLIRTPMFDELEREDPAQHAQLTGAVLAMTAVGRIGTPAEIGDAAVFLAGDTSSFITGAALPVDGGYTAV
jgi:NAD(P)-dependent dehydrogenase (short-subunit alcohol dehydrogenase family)